MKCILTECAWKGESCCRSLGECGAAYALAKASEAGGYLVMQNSNKTISALKKAGFVSTTWSDGYTMIITANPKAVEFAAMQGRVEAAA